MNPRDARALRPEAARPRGRRLAARPRARASSCGSPKRSRPGQVFVPFHWAEANANQVTQSAFDPISREPNYKQCAVRVERAGAGGATMKRLVVVGNGMAGVACVEQILKHSPQFEITVFGDETHVNYNRILLSSVLAGEKAADDIVLNPLEWYQRNDIDLRARRPHRRRRSPSAKTVTGDDGSVTPYDTLLLATGSSRVRCRRSTGSTRTASSCSARSTTRASCCERAGPGVQGRRHRRRPARPRGRARPAGAGLRRHRRAPDGRR